MNSFANSKFEDFEILDDDGRVVGHVRIKPSGVLWRARREHHWYGLSLDQLHRLAKEHGKRQEK